jgi:hypothetical protein
MDVSFGFDQLEGGRRGAHSPMRASLVHPIQSPWSRYPSSFGGRGDARVLRIAPVYFGRVDINSFQPPKTGQKRLPKCCQSYAGFWEVLKSYFYGKSRYSKHLLDYTSEWTRD